MPRGYRRVPFIITQIRKLPRRRRNPRGAPRYKVSLVRDPSSPYITVKPMSTAADIAKVGHKLMEGADREEFWVLCMDQKNKIIGVNLVSTGTLTASLVHPREAYKAAIILNSAAMAYIHNHPSGKPQPSIGDRELTERLVSVSKLMGIRLLDHVIIGDEGTYFSFQEAGWL